MTDINTSEATILEALNNKVDLASGGSQATTDYVVEWKLPTSSDSTWYRKYKSGWIEQGGECSIAAQAAASTSTATLTLPKTMKDTYYSVSAVRKTDGGNTHELTQTWVVKTTTTCAIQYYSIAATSAASVIIVEVKGMGA